MQKVLNASIDHPLQDLRNQGSSPHVPGMTYLHMATDVLHFCETHKLKHVSLMGHSMCAQMYPLVTTFSNASASVGEERWLWHSHSTLHFRRPFLQT